MCHKESDQVAFGEGLERRGVQQSIAIDIRAECCFREDCQSCRVVGGVFSSVSPSVPQSLLS